MERYSRGVIRYIAAGVVLGLLMTAVFAILPVSMAAFGDKAEFSGASDGRRVWTYQRRWGIGVEWVNVDLQQEYPVSSGVAMMDHLPTWARPPHVADSEEFFRKAVLVVGWPWPWLSREWEDQGGEKSFPPPATYDEDRRALDRACWLFLNEPEMKSMGVLWTRLAATAGFWLAICVVPAWIWGMKACRRRKKNAPGTRPGAKNI